MKVLASWETLIRKAHAVGQARLALDGAMTELDRMELQENLDSKIAELHEYEDVVRLADGMIIPN